MDVSTSNSRLPFHQHGCIYIRVNFYSQVHVDICIYMYIFISRHFLIFTLLLFFFSNFVGTFILISLLFNFISILKKNLFWEKEWTSEYWHRLPFSEMYHAFISNFSKHNSSPSHRSAGPCYHWASAQASLQCTQHATSWFQRWRCFPMSQITKLKCPPTRAQLTVLA